MGEKPYQTKLTMTDYCQWKNSSVLLEERLIVWLGLCRDSEDVTEYMSHHGIETNYAQLLNKVPRDSSQSWPAAPKLALSNSIFHLVSLG